MGNSNQSETKKEEIPEPKIENQKEKIEFELPEYISLKDVFNAESNNEWKKKFTNIMSKYSFAIFSDLDEEYVKLFQDLQEVKKKYFGQEKEKKMENCSQGKEGLDNLNLGYVSVGKVR